MKLSRSKFSFLNCFKSNKSSSSSSSSSVNNNENDNNENDKNITPIIERVRSSSTLSTYEVSPYLSRMTPTNSNILSFTNDQQENDFIPFFARPNSIEWDLSLSPINYISTPISTPTPPPPPTTLPPPLPSLPSPSLPSSSSSSSSSTRKSSRLLPNGKKSSKRSILHSNRHSRSSSSASSVSNISSVSSASSISSVSSVSSVSSASSISSLPSSTHSPNQSYFSHLSHFSPPSSPLILGSSSTGKPPANLERKISNRSAQLLINMKSKAELNAAKGHSTSSIFLEEGATTLKNPNMQEIVNCVSLAIRFHIKRGVAAPQKTFIDIFDETKFPISKSGPPPNPNENDIAKFLGGVAGAVDLTPECCVLCLVFIERLICLTSLTVHETNWRRLILATLALSAKIWIDLSMWNVDFANIIPTVDIADMNRLENELLALIQFNVSVTASLYAKYFFELRSFSRTKKLPEKALNDEQARKLEERSAAVEKQKAPPKLAKSKSMTELHAKPIFQ